MAVEQDEMQNVFSVAAANAAQTIGQFSQAALQNAMVQQANQLTGLGQVTGVIGANQLASQYASHAKTISPRVDTPEELGAWNASITDLVNLWLAKHGSAWVSEEDFDENGGFWRVVVSRLRSLNKVERRADTRTWRVVE